MKFRVEGKFELYSFDINVVNRFLITSPNCGVPLNSIRYRDSGYIDKSRTHELTHCNTFTTAINISNQRVVNSGWHLTRGAADDKKEELISQANHAWSVARHRAITDKDVAGQPRSIVEGECLIERDNGFYPYH